MTDKPKSWSNAFLKHVERERRDGKRACVRCGKGPTSIMWSGQWTHLLCLTPTEMEDLWGGLNLAGLRA